MRFNEAAARRRLRRREELVEGMIDAEGKAWELGAGQLELSK